MPERRHYPFRGNPDFTDEAYEMPETKTSPPPPNQEKEEDQRGGGVSEHFRAKEDESTGDDYQSDNPCCYHSDER